MHTYIYKHVVHHRILSDNHTFCRESLSVTGRSHLMWEVRGSQSSVSTPVMAPGIQDHHTCPTWPHPPSVLRFGGGGQQRQHLNTSVTPSPEL
ncbi:hypothetical protein SKAU_G00005690 [Synaphobranchus kaupii]|uniref:Uncharacterized protein n=1 Tax=Synaphobranchus kaupii TaxID=118154 RepID=A0A9Q1GA83_SYNKA|nr:hypothetical protein SKAU_G00005690 [Synaphobranchus kaupii]